MKHSKVKTRKVDPKVLRRVAARRQGNGQTWLQGACSVAEYTARTEALEATMATPMTDARWVTVAA